MKRVINFVKGRRDDRRDNKFVNYPICVEITNPAGQKVQSEDEHIIGLQSGYGYQVDLNGKDKNMTKFHKAAWQGNVDKVKNHLKKADVNSVDHANRTALHFAVAQGHSNVASFLLGAKAQLDLRDSDGMTPFLKAVECGNKECVNILLEQGADVNVVDRNGNTGLHLAAKLGFLNISSLLLMKGANINISNNVGEFALHLATEGEHRELVALLLCSGGAQINVIDRDNRTPLMLAARYGHASLVSLFLEHGASLEACDSNGWTAEDYALIGGHQQLALDLKVPAREQLCKEMEDAVVNGNSSDETKEEKPSDDCGRDVCSDESEANQPEIVHETAIVQINSHPIESNNGNNDFHDRTIEEEDDNVGTAINEEKEDRKEEGETVESPRSCITPPPLRPPRSWDLIQAGMIDEKEVQRRSLTTLGTLRSRRESFNENCNNNNNNGGSSPNQANDDLEKITDIVKTVQMEGLVDDESSDGEENLPLDRAASLRRGGGGGGKAAPPLERTPSVDLTLTEEDLTKSKESKGCRASSDGGTLGREDTLQGYEEVWEKNANISEPVDNVAAENNNKLQQCSDVNDESNEVFDTGQLTTDISEQLVQRNREINTAVGYVTNEIYRIMIEKNEYQSDGVEKVVYTSSSLDNLDERKQPRFIDIESSRSCDNLDNRYMTLEEKLCSGIYSAETLDTEPDNEGTHNLDLESPVGTVIKRNMHREVQSLDTLDDYDQCCSRGCVEARPLKKHSRNKSVSAGQHGWSKSVDVLSKPSNIDRIQIDTKKIDAQLECYDEALRELAQVELMKRNNSSDRSSGGESSSRRRSGGASCIKDKKQPSLPPPLGEIPYLSEVVSTSSSSQKSREYFMKPKDESDFSINQDFSPLPKVLDKAGSVDGFLDMDRMSTSVELTSIKSDSRFNQSNDSSFNHDLPPPPPPPPPVTNEMFATDLYLNLETLPGDFENENVVLNGIKLKTDEDTDDSESKRAREVENNLYKLEKDLYNINMSAIMKPRTTDVNQNGIVHQDIVVANGEMPPFDHNLRSKVFEKGTKQTCFAVFDGVRKQREDSLSPVDRSAGEDNSPKVPPRYKRSLRKGKSESEVWKVSDGRTSKSRSKSASMYSEVEALFEKPSKGRKKSGGSGEIQEKSESDSELCERPLRRKRKILLAMRGVVAGSKDSEDDDDTSTGDPPFWLSTDKGGHFARQDTVLATQPARLLEKSQDPPGCARASKPGDKPTELDKDWTSSDADTASGSDEVVIGNAFSMGSHHKLLKEHLRQATNDKTALEEAVAVLSEREERLQYELADARQALSARQDTVHIVQEQSRRMEARYSAVLDEVLTLRHSLSSAHLELRHLRDLCDKLAMEKTDALDELSRLRDDLNTEQSGGVAEKRRITSCEAKPEQMQILQRQKQEAERRNEILVNHLEEAMRQCESARSEKDALTRQNITDIKKLQQDTLLWKERYEDCLGRLERIESECQPRLFEAQRTIEMLRSSIKQMEAEKELYQDNWKAKVMDEIVSRIKRNQNANNLLPKSSCDKGPPFLGSCMKRQAPRNKKCPCIQNNSRSCICRGVSSSNKNSKVNDGKLKCSKRFSYVYDVAERDSDKEYLSKLSLLLDHNRKLLENLFTAKKEKDCIRKELCEIRRNLECDLHCRLDYQSPSGSLSGDRGEIVKESDNRSDLMKIERKYNCLSKVKSILSKEEVEVEGVLRSIQEVGKDLENVLNNLHTQIVLVKSLNQFEPENESSSQSSSKTSSCDRETHPPHIDRCDMRFLVKELVDIRKDLLYLHGESERISKMLEFIFKQKRNGNVQSDELKSTTESVQSCSKEILKLNSEVLKLHKIIQTLMIEFSKNVCKCAGSYDDGNRNESNIPANTNPGDNQNRYSNSSKEYGQNCLKLNDDRNKDSSPCQKSIKASSDLKSEMNEKNLLSGEPLCNNRKNLKNENNDQMSCKKRLDYRKEELANRQLQNTEGFTRKELSAIENTTPANEQQKCGLVINGKNGARFSITNDNIYKNDASELKNSRKFREVRQNLLLNHYSSMDRNSSATDARKSDDRGSVENKAYSIELVVMDDEGFLKISDNRSRSILGQMVVSKSRSEIAFCDRDSVANNSNRDSAYSNESYIKIDPQSSSQEIIYLKKALTNKTSKLSNELSQDHLATDSETLVGDNTTNSVANTELLDPLTSSQTVTIEAGYQSEPVFSLGERDNEYLQSYPSSSDFNYVDYSNKITTESLPDSLKPCENKQKSFDEREELGENSCSRDDRNYVNSNRISDDVSCQDRPQGLNLKQESVPTKGDSPLACQKIADNMKKSDAGLEKTFSPDKIKSRKPSDCKVLSKNADDPMKVIEDDVVSVRKSTDPKELSEQKLSTVDDDSLGILSVEQNTESFNPTSESKVDGGLEQDVSSKSPLSYSANCYVSLIKESSVSLASKSIQTDSPSNQESNRDKSESNEQVESSGCSSSKLSKADDIAQQSKTDSVCSEIASKDNESDETSRNSNVQPSKISIGVQTSKISDLNDCANTPSETRVLQTRDSAIEKSLEAIKQIEIKSEILVKSGTSDQSFSKNTCKLVPSKSKCGGIDQTVSNDTESNDYCVSSNRPEVEEDKSNDYSKTKDLNEVDNIIQESKSEPERLLSSDFVDKEDNYYNRNDSDKSNVSVGVQTHESFSDMECAIPSVTGRSQSRDNSIVESQVDVRQIGKESEILINNGTSDHNVSDENCKTETSKSKSTVINQTVPDYCTEQAKTSDYSGSSDMNVVDDNSMQEIATKSERAGSSEVVSKEGGNSCGALKNLSDQKSSTISVGVQTKESTNDFEGNPSSLVSDILKSFEGAIEKSRASIREIYEKSKIIGTPNRNIDENNCKTVSEDPSESGILKSSEGEIEKSRLSIIEIDGQSTSEKNCQTDFELEGAGSYDGCGSSKVNNRVDIAEDPNDNFCSSELNGRVDIDEDKCNNYCSSKELNEVDDVMQQPETNPENVVGSDIASRENEEVFRGNSDVQQSNNLDDIHPKDDISDVEECGTPLESGSSEGAVGKSKTTTRRIIKRTEYLNNRSASDQNTSESTQTQASDSNCEPRLGGLSVCICSSCDCSTKQNPNDKSKKSCFKHLSTCLKRQNNSGSPKNNDKQVNFVFENIKLDPNMFYEKSDFNKLLPLEKSLGLFFKSNLTGDYSLDDFKSNLKSSDWRLNPFLERKMAKQLFELSLSDSSVSSDNPLEDENNFSHVQIYADLKRPILLPGINLSSITCKDDSSKDVITDMGQKLSAAQSTVDFTLQAAAPVSNLLSQEDEAIRLEFQQVENLECPDSFETTKIAFVNDVNKTSNGFQECDQQQQQQQPPPNSKAGVSSSVSVSRERQAMEVGRIRQQALLESENNLSAKIAEINSVLHQQLVEQDRRRAHNEMQMKTEFELTRQKLLMELSKVQTALKAKEAEERALREKYEKLSRDVEKTAETKRKQLIEKSYSLNLAHPSTLWEKELSIKRNVVQAPLPPPPPPPPLPPPDLPSSLLADDRFSHLSLRAQLHQSITQHRTNPRNPSDLVNLATNSNNSQFEEVASGSSVAASASSSSTKR